MIMLFIERGKVEARLIEKNYIMLSKQHGNKFVVYKLDRLARSTKQLYEISDRIQEKGAEFISIQDERCLTCWRFSQNLKGILSEKETELAWTQQNKEEEKAGGLR